MPSLLEKIEASAEQRLKGEGATTKGPNLDRYRSYLKVETHRLKILHRGGAGGQEVCRGRSAVMDALLRHLLNHVIAGMEPETSKKPTRWALVAIGGYGRGELNPCSDIDIMFLHNVESAVVVRGRVHPYLTTLTERMLYPLWDVGIKVGHSVRSVDDCVSVANSDMQSKTSLLEARLIAGDDELFRRAESVFLAKCVRGMERGYIQSRLEDQATRRAKFGGSACMQEPNLKNGVGSLRDYQNLIWMAFFKYRTKSLEELEARELVTSLERRQLQSAYDFLLRVRTELHYETERPADILVKPLQAVVAWNLGYKERAVFRRLERFMRDLYVNLRNVYLITRTIEQRLALLPDLQRRLPSIREIYHRGRQRVSSQEVDGFRFFDGEIHPLTPRIFRDKPRRLMRVFFYAQQRGLTLNAEVVQLIRNHLSLVDRGFRIDEHIRDTFLEILNQRGNVAPILRAMHEVGFLGKYLPEFGKLTCLVQHEFYHQFTTDEHTLNCLSHLDSIWEAEDPPHSRYSEMLHNLERPNVLYLALLLHDVGKAQRSRPHTEVGAELASVVSARLGLDRETEQSLKLLIKHHLLLAEVSQRHDLDDPTVARNVASEVQSVENLGMLTLHTLADSLGTSDKLWNGFKDSLLRQLHQKVEAALTGETSFQVAEEKRIEVLADTVNSLLPRAVSEEETEAHFDNLPRRYFRAHTAEQIVVDLKLTNAFMRRQLCERDQALIPVVHWRNEADRGFTEVKVCTWDRPGLFEKIAGSLTAAGLNILGAQIFSRRDGIALDTFSVTRAGTGLLISREERDKCERILINALNGNRDLSKDIARLKPAAPLYQIHEGERIPTEVRIDNKTSDTWTLVDVEAEDQVGLLYHISKGLSDLDLDISLAKVCTEKGAAIDSFYVREQDRSKITSRRRQSEIKRTLTQALKHHPKSA